MNLQELIEGFLIFWHCFFRSEHYCITEHSVKTDNEHYYCGKCGYLRKDGDLNIN